PHYFPLPDEAVRGFNPKAKLSPPLRQAEDVAAIRAGLADGTIDCIATDHAPHSSLEKDVEFAVAAKGIIGLETSLGLTLKLVAEGVLSLKAAIERLSTAPARILGVNGGSLAPGAAADVTLIDPNLTWQVEVKKFKSKSRNSPFQGWELPGRAVMTIVGGEIIYTEGGR
ncbi:MAG: amidohydrolase family protein, partial [Desulfobacca sp.]|nr:amidohydrolase family protein [Desulfobacca sp.]